jgi:hypothetical protein
MVTFSTGCYIVRTILTLLYSWSFKSQEIDDATHFQRESAACERYNFTTLYAKELIIMMRDKYLAT